MNTIGDKEADKKSKTLGNVMIGGVVAALIGLLVFSVNEIVAYVIFAIAGGFIIVPGVMLDLIRRKQEKLDLAADMKVRYNERFAEKAELKKYDVKRYPIKFDDKEAKKELEVFTKNFLDKVVFPEGFEKFLGEYSKEVMEKRFILDPFLPSTMYGTNYYEVFTVVAPEEIKDYNLEFITKRDDYHTMFRNVVFFADDESGHCHFFLDYSKSQKEPMVKYLDDESDQVSLVASNFGAFSSKLVDEQYVEVYGSIEDNSIAFMNWFTLGLKKLKPAKNYIVNIYEDSDKYTCDLISTGSRDFEDDIEEFDVYSRENPYIITNRKDFFEFEDVLKHFKNLLKFAFVYSDYFSKLLKEHNILYGFVDGDLIAFNKYKAIKVINECQIYEFETDNTKYVNITMDELVAYFKQGFKKEGFVDDGNRWIKQVSGKVLVFEIQKSAFNKDYSYFNIGYASSIAQAKCEHKKWDSSQRWLYDGSAESTFESIMKWFNDNSK